MADNRNVGELRGGGGETFLEAVQSIPNLSLPGSTAQWEKVNFVLF